MDKMGDGKSVNPVDQALESKKSLFLSESDYESGSDALQEICGLLETRWVIHRPTRTKGVLIPFDLLHGMRKSAEMWEAKVNAVKQKPDLHQTAPVLAVGANGQQTVSDAAEMVKMYARNFENARRAFLGVSVLYVDDTDVEGCNPNTNL